MKPEYKHISISGTVTAVFAHRFVIEGKDGKHLADIGPDAVDFVDVQEGDKVTVEGERKPSEIKVTKITKGSDKLIEVEHIKRHQRDGAREHRDSVKAVVAVEREGFEVVGARAERPSISRFSGGRRRESSRDFTSSSTEGSTRKSRPTATIRSGVRSVTHCNRDRRLTSRITIARRAHRVLIEARGDSYRDGKRAQA